MAPAFCPLMRNDPHVGLQIERYYAWFFFDDVEEHSAELNRIWKLKHALGCPQCAKYRKHGNNGLCGRCKKLRRIIRNAEAEIAAQVPAMLTAWRDENLSIEAHKVYNRAAFLAAQAQRILR